MKVRTYAYYTWYIDRYDKNKRRLVTVGSWLYIPGVHRRGDTPTKEASPSHFSDPTAPPSDKQINRSVGIVK